MINKDASAVVPPGPATRVPDDAPPFAWCCAVCGRYETFGYDLLKRFAQEGWPECCEHVVFAVAARATHRGSG